MCCNGQEIHHQRKKLTLWWRTPSFWEDNIVESSLEPPQRLFDRFEIVYILGVKNHLNLWLRGHTHKILRKFLLLDLFVMIAHSCTPVKSHTPFSLSICSDTKVKACSCWVSVAKQRDWMCFTKIINALWRSVRFHAGLELRVRLLWKIPYAQKALDFMKFRFHPAFWQTQAKRDQVNKATRDPPTIKDCWLKMTEADYPKLRLPDYLRNPRDSNEHLECH